jgi:hypothetical protein
MKLKLLSLALITTAAGCTTTVEGGNYYTDVVERVVNPGSFPGSPFVTATLVEDGVNGGNPVTSRYMATYNTLENGQTFDAAVGLFRAQTTNGLSDPNEIPTGRMAFELNNAPAQVGSATLNNDALAWLPSASAIGWDYSYAKADPNLNGSQDSMAFSYVDFNGETYKDTLDVAPAFGTITFPDTISLSHGCIISYQHPNPNDSIGIYLMGEGDTNFFLTRPDTGSIVFATQQLPFKYNGFTIYFYRWNWSTITTPSGRKIGVYSSMETDGQYIQAKP